MVCFTVSSSNIRFIRGTDMKNKLKTIQALRRFSFEDWGGTETVAWNTSRQLMKKGHCSEIISTSALKNTDDEIIGKIPVKRFDYFYPYWNLSKKNKFLLDRKGGNPYSWSLYKYLLQGDNIDIVHCHTMQRIANTVRQAARKKRIPYVISFHGGFFNVPQSELDEMQEPLRGTFNYGKILDILLQNQKFLDDADGIICVGYNEYLSTREKYPDKVVEYLPNGVDIDRFKVEKNSSFKSKFNIPDNREVILCISRIDSQKNQEILLDLLKILRDRKENIHLVLIGPVTSQAYFDKLQLKIDRNFLNDNITLIKGLKADDPDLVNAYKSADYFILPSVHEPFGIVILEAWASGVPVIASSVGGLQKLISDQKTGLLFSSSSLDDLLEQFILLRKNPELKKSITENAFQAVCAEYSWSTVTEQLIEFYRKVIDKYKRLF
jgi:glycosyltransferase involved in cell wall biosynthesis